MAKLIKTGQGKKKKKTGQESWSSTHMPSAAICFHLQTPTERLRQMASAAIYFYFTYLTPLNSYHYQKVICASMTHQKEMN